MSAGLLDKKGFGLVLSFEVGFFDFIELFAANVLNQIRRYPRI
jgi:hypothetical protein